MNLFKLTPPPSRLQMTVQVFDVYTHQPTDDPLPIIVEVDDKNDNAPTVDGSILCTVAEKSKIGEKQDI